MLTIRQHRDVKPDNFLVGGDGHLKISDFGLAFDGKLEHCHTYFNGKRVQLLDKFGIRVIGDELDVAESVTAAMHGRLHDDQNKPRAQGIRPAQDNVPQTLQRQRRPAMSIVGTAQYMAPEIVLGQPYDGRCDWWSLGIVVYEMLYGRTPFYDENRQCTKENIAAYREHLHFPAGDRLGRPACHEPRRYDAPSATAIDFMQSQLTGKEHRLSSGAYHYPDLTSRRRDSGVSLADAKHVKSFDAEEVKAHPWFASISWSVMHGRQPPWIPSVQPGQEVTKYFESESSITAENEWEQKRAKDKILRDPQLGPEALEERQKTAFYGYTYRRLTLSAAVPGVQSA